MPQPSPQFVGTVEYIKNSSSLVSPLTFIDEAALAAQFPASSWPGKLGIALVDGTPSLFRSEAGDWELLGEAEPPSGPQAYYAASYGAAIGVGLTPESVVEDSILVTNLEIYRQQGSPPEWVLRSATGFGAFDPNALFMGREGSPSNSVQNLANVVSPGPQNAESLHLGGRPYTWWPNSSAFFRSPSSASSVPSQLTPDPRGYWRPSGFSLFTTHDVVLQHAPQMNPGVEFSTGDGFEGSYTAGDEAQFTVTPCALVSDFLATDQVGYGVTIEKAFPPASPAMTALSLLNMPVFLGDEASLFDETRPPGFYFRCKLQADGFDDQVAEGGGVLFRFVDTTGPEAVVVTAGLSVFANDEGDPGTASFHALNRVAPFNPGLIPFAARDGIFRRGRPPAPVSRTATAAPDAFVPTGPFTTVEIIEFPPFPNEDNFTGAAFALVIDGEPVQFFTPSSPSSEDLSLPTTTDLQVVVYSEASNAEPKVRVNIWDMLLMAARPV